MAWRLKDRTLKNLVGILLIVVLILVGIALWQGSQMKKTVLKEEKVAQKVEKTIEIPEEKEVKEIKKVEKPKEEKVAQKKEEKAPQKPPKKEVKAVEKKNYELTAEKGEGITHLARKALKTYLSERKEDLKLTPEHKIYIEDYIQKKLGSRWLYLGEKITISQDLIEEGIGASQKLTERDLENLKKFSRLVPDL